MTKIMEKYVTEVTRERVVETTCDKCGVIIPINNNQYHDNEFELVCVDIETYPDNGSSRGWCVEDLCDNCTAWLKNLLESNGVKISVVDIDW